jgi:hypothetical protein
MIFMQFYVLNKYIFQMISNDQYSTHITFYIKEINAPIASKNYVQRHMK